MATRTDVRRTDPVPATETAAGREAAPERFTLGPETFGRFCLGSLVLVSLIVATGAAVRLTGSGEGCPDWPSCYQHQFTPQLASHALIEFSNRMITGLLSVMAGATFIAALRRRPSRRDLAWLSAALIAGIVLQALYGEVVVATNLNPYVVMVHFLATMPLVAVAVVLLHRSTRDYKPGSGRSVVPTLVRRMSWGVAVLLAVVLAAGSATTGSGPHSGSSQGHTPAKRLPIALRDMAELHSSLALLLIGVTIGLAVALHTIEVPERVRRAGRLLVVAMTAQAAVGYTQYFTHLPVALVEVHVIGATVLVIGVTQFLLALTHHPKERLTGVRANKGSVVEAAGPAPPVSRPADPAPASATVRATSVAGPPDND